MDPRYQNTISGFVTRQLENQKTFENGLSLCKSRFDSDIALIHDFLKEIVRACGENQIAEIGLQPVEIEYFPAFGTVNAVFRLAIDGIIKIVDYTANKESSTILGRVFEVGSHDMPFLFIRETIEQWLVRSSYVETVY